MKNGIVIRSTGSWFTVRDDEGTRYECRIRGNLRLKGIQTTNPVAVGDRVDFQYLEKESQDHGQLIGMIQKIYERQNYIIRRSQNLSHPAHIIAANIDQALLVVTISYPVTTTTFIDRYLASAEAYRIPVVLVFNKTDRYTPAHFETLHQLTQLYTHLGYPCLHTSALSMEGMEDLKNKMKDKISVFNGHSGVGKSTLINLLQPGLNLRTSEISDYHEKGKHTTTFSELFELSFGGYIIDTPGIKAFGMLEMEPWEISHYFREIFSTSSNCQYNNCSHTHEPQCAVKDAVEKGDIALSRYISYLGLLESDDKYRQPF